MRILLIRHGPSAHSLPAWLPLNRAALERWRNDYDAAGIVEDASAPASVHAHAARAHIMAASDLPRAVESASHLWPGRPVVISPLFREAPIRIPSLGPVRVPLPLWALIIHAQWAIDILRGQDMTAESRARVTEAATWCEQACRARSTSAVVAVVTHGVFRRELARALNARGWKSGGRRSYAPWSVWELVGQSA